MKNIKDKTIERISKNKLLTLKITVKRNLKIIH